jgi:hypothetical protein
MTRHSQPDMTKGNLYLRGASESIELLLSALDYSIPKMTSAFPFHHLRRRGGRSRASMVPFAGVKTSQGFGVPIRDAGTGTPDCVVVPAIGYKMPGPLEALPHTDDADLKLGYIKPGHRDQLVGGLKGIENRRQAQIEDSIEHEDVNANIGIFPYLLADSVTKR